ncbi:PTS mannose/fructose/sorbose transporter subunit IIAB [Tannockella kyphosi]|uniref:PTS mannose/fructose/sorbose transporter subunit IIAB n=1 Tax=Tannockella kyphosi TaxID=2899121 RepID=UPI002012CAB9|nr:PTS mannose/fructose/sorbose transporter subunit IIAB [Tannockella kyphosi]
MKYIVVSHGHYAVECINSCHMITGDLGKFEPVSFLETMSKEDVVLEIEQCIKKYDEKDVTILVDIIGGTPFNCAMELQAKYPTVPVVAGVSLSLCIILSMNDSLEDAIKDSVEYVKLFKNLKEVSVVSKEKQANAPKVSSTGFNLEANLDSCKDESMNDKGIAHIRVDERLIHGQVATMWTNVTKATRILVVDDATCKDEVTKVALRTAAPNNVKLSILTKKGALKRINAGQYKGEKVLLLVKRPNVVYSLIEAGLNVDKFNVGNCSKHPDTVALKKTVYLYDEEINQINELMKNGVTITAQMVPSDDETNIMSFINNIERGGL